MFLAPPSPGPQSERLPVSWRQFASSVTAETRMGDANGDGGQGEHDDDDNNKDVEMGEADKSERG